MRRKKKHNSRAGKLQCDIVPAQSDDVYATRLHWHDGLHVQARGLDWCVSHDSALSPPPPPPPPPPLSLSKPLILLNRYGENERRNGTGTERAGRPPSNSASTHCWTDPLEPGFRQLIVVARSSNFEAVEQLLLYIQIFETRPMSEWICTPASSSFSHPTPGIFPTPKDLIISPQQAAGQQLQ
jgi:hypothetical protein